MNKHELKIWPVHYNNVKAGTKTFEIRKIDKNNMDRCMTKLEQYLKEVEQRCEVATKGPWEIYGNGGPYLFIGHKDEKGYPIAKCIENNKFIAENPRENAVFISQARTDVPKLLEIVKFLIVIYNKPNELDHIDVKRYKEKVKPNL